MESCRPTSLGSLFFKERPNGIILITRANNSDQAASITRTNYSFIMCLIPRLIILAKFIYAKSGVMSLHILRRVIVYCVMAEIFHSLILS